MTRFLESPLPYLLIGLAVESILLILYLQTRHMLYLAGMLLVAAIAGGGILFERAYVTDREAVEGTIYALAESIEADDTAAVLGFISTQAPGVRADAEREMNHFEIELARVIGRVKIEFTDGVPQPSARVEFRSVVRAKEARSGIVGGGAFKFVVTLSREGEEWRLVDYRYTASR